MHPKRRTKLPVGKPGADYARLWTLVDGAVADAFRNHPEYLATGISEKVVRTSVNKRVVGAIRSFANERGVVGDNGG